MDKVKVLLKEAKVPQYLDKFQKAGYDSLPQILSMGAAAFKEMGEHTEMLPDHFSRLRDTINAIKNSVSTPRPEASAEASVEAPSATKRKRTPELKTRHNTLKELRLASLRHSTQQGCSTMIDSKKSGSKCQVYRWNQMKKTILAARANTDYIGPKAKTVIGN